MSWRYSVGFAGLAVILVAGIATYIHRDRISFVRTCYSNGNDLGSCNCTFGALPELSASYRALAQSWAKDPAGLYARSVLYSIAKSTLKATTGISEDLASSDINGYARWLKRATDMAHWPQTKKVIQGTAELLATTVAAKTVVAPIVLAGLELQESQRIMRRACGKHVHFLTPVDKLSDAVVESAMSYSNAVVETARSTTAGVTKTVSDIVATSSSAIVNAARKIGGFFGGVRVEDESKQKSDARD